MSYLAEMKQKRDAQREAALSMAGKKRDESLATMSNPDSNVDELGRAIRYFFLPIATIWVWYIGYVFTAKELTGMVEPWQVVLLSIGLPLFVQILKVYGATKALRAFHFKWYDRSGHDLVFWSCTGILVVIMFGWSLKISIFDIKDASNEIYTKQNSDSLNVVLRNATAGIDAQINSLNNENADAGKMRTKKGRIAWSGQSIKMANATTLSALNAQKQEIVSQTMADYKAKKLDVEKGAKHRGNFFQRFGGFGEALEILMLVLLGLVEAINRNQNAARLGVKTDQAAATPKQTGFEGHTEAAETPKQTGFEDFTRKQNPINNELQNRPKMGFYTNNPFRETVPQSIQAVAQSEIAVPQQLSVIGADQILKHCKSKLQSEIPNLHNPQASKSTVSGRIEKVLDETFIAMWNKQFLPSKDVAIKVYQYLADTAFPALNNAGYPYQKDVFIMKALSDVIERLPAVEA